MENKKTDYTVVVIGGGGMKGLYQTGALYFLQEQNLLNAVHSYVGSSVGSLISLLKIIGCSVKETISHFLEMDIEKNVKINVEEAKKNRGLLSHRYFKKTLEKIVKDKLGMIPTLKQLYEKTKKDFYCVVTDKRKRKAVYFSRHTFPEISCVEAVLLSCSIPYAFYEIKYKNTYYTDGVLSDPYPINLLDDRSNKILGIYLCSHETKQKNDIFSDFVNTVNIPICILRNIYQQMSSDRCQHLRIKTEKGDVLGLRTSNQDKAYMVMSGYYSALQFFSEQTENSNKENFIVENLAQEKK